MSKIFNACKTAKLLVFTFLLVDSLSVLAVTNTKAVLVQGISPEDNLYDNATNNVKQAYRALKFQGFSDANIKLLTNDSANKFLNADDNGTNDYDGKATPTNVANAIMGWAGGVEDVVIFLQGHGTSGSNSKMQIYPSEKLNSSTLNRYLNELETKISGKLIIILDTCYGGSFIPTLLKPKRYVLTSSNAAQYAIIAGYGNSFSGNFWGSLAFFGGNVGTSFMYSRSAMSTQKVNTGGLSSYQQAQYDADGVAGESATDANLLNKICLGNCSFAFHM